jgi:hypothetical protein
MFFPLLQRITDLSLQLKKGGASSGDISWCASSRSGVALRARPDPQVHQLVMLQSSEKSSSENPVQKRTTLVPTKFNNNILLCCKNCFSIFYMENFILMIMGWTSRSGLTSKQKVGSGFGPIKNTPKLQMFRCICETGAHIPLQKSFNK